MSRGICKVVLDEELIPRSWYNILPDLPEPLPPPLNPATRSPVNPKDLEAIFAKELVRQEVSQDRWIPIPDEVRDVYKLWRPTPLYRAYRLEKALKTPAKIYYKYEGVSPPGSHKPNTAVAQAYYNMIEGIERLTTETGAGQWGSALAFACMLFGLKSTIYMVKVSYNQKPYRRILMEMWGAEVLASPSSRTEAGRKILEKDPDNPGSLGIAISEAIEDAVKDPRAKYTLGSVLNHVLLHQTVIGLEAREQFAVIDEYPDMIIGCIGGGSSFSGIFWPFYYDKVSGKAPKDIRFIAVEPTACPSITQGFYTYDHGDTARLTPLLKMYTLGHTFIPPPIHAGGLRYHGKAPTLCLLARHGIVDVRAYDQVSVFDAAALFTKTEGILPAPEPSHAIKAVIDEAIRCREENEEKTILFLLCGHGLLDMQAFDDYLRGKLHPYYYPREHVIEALRELKTLYPWLNGELSKALSE
ncbi:MAG: TrpB-like pyridoxal phosphate-dependent enzyme [Candidatus Bathyarchaeia archaeon]|nr:TrpB-like pyridoxal phosphate-dependent enzyme [Candidatus Bathyarchaeota archaeon]